MALIPAMNNLAAQQHGAKATGEDMVNISNMMGRALQGNVGALTRCGISFNDAQANVLKFGNESQRAAMLAHHHQTLDRMFECLSAEQKDQLEETLGILTAHLEEIKSDPAFAQSIENAWLK